MNNIEILISTIRDSFPCSVETYTKGSCYKFSLILRQVYPQSEIWYDPIEGHIYTKIDKYWYDIRGKHYKLPKHSHILDHKTIKHKPHRW